MQYVRSNLFLRDDTFFGVCEGLGEDFGLPSNLFRAAFALGLFFDPLVAAGTYFALGVLVALSRWLVPNPRVAAPSQPVDAAPAAPSEAADNDVPFEGEDRLIAA